jgi:hypothetical protein
MLNPDETVVLVGECGPHRLLFGFDPKPGTYRAHVPPGFTLEEGSTWNFMCPVCGSSLESEAAPGLCAIDLATQGVRHRLFFSPTVGERATFVVSAEGVQSYGEHADQHSLEILDLL